MPTPRSVLSTGPTSHHARNEDEECELMNYLDHRLSKILSENRIEYARSIRERRSHIESEGCLRRRLGLWLIAHGEHLAHGKPKAV